MPAYPDSCEPRLPRRKKRRRRFPVPGIVLVLFLVGGVLFLEGRFARSHSSYTLPPVSHSEQGEVEAVGEDIRSQLQELAREKPRAGELLSHLEDYPQELLELAVRNPETVDFVADYPQEKDRVPAETVEEAERGTIPLLLQWDPRWGCAQYGDGPMALNGCGPTGPQRLRSHRPVHGDLRPDRGQDCHPLRGGPVRPGDGVLCGRGGHQLGAHVRRRDTFWRRRPGAAPEPVGDGERPGGGRGNPSSAAWAPGTSPPADTSSSWPG